MFKYKVEGMVDNVTSLKLSLVTHVKSNGIYTDLVFNQLLKARESHYLASIGVKH